MISKRIPSPSLPIYTINSYLSHFFLYRCKEFLIGVCEGSPSPIMLAILFHLYDTYYFFPEPPGAIMVLSGTWAKVLLHPSCKASAIA